MDEPYISIITPSHNQAKFLEKNLTSVCNQEHENVEHIVVDGGSEDGSVEILKEYEDQYNLRWISESDRGQSHAINKGINMANGDWIGWQNSDDFYLPSSFNIISEVIIDEQDLDVVYGDTVFVNEEGNEITRTFHTRPSKFVQKHWSLFASNQSTFIRRKVIEEIGGLDEDLYYTMDAKLMWELLQGDYRHCCVNEPIGVLRVHENAKTAGDIEKEQERELNEIYPNSMVDILFTEASLRYSAIGLKLIYLLSDNRWDAIKYNIENKYRQMKDTDSQISLVRSIFGMYK